MTFFFIISFLPTVSLIGVPYLVAGVLGVAVKMLFLRAMLGVFDVVFVEDGVGSFILATSPGPGGRSTFVGTLRLELLRLRRGVSVEDARNDVGDGNSGGEESGEDDGSRKRACGAGVKGLGGSGGRLDRK
jgi:hypothetical protein